MVAKSISSALALGLLVSGQPSRPASAATPTASFGVSAIVQATCLVSASAVTLGTYAPAIANATPTVSINCTNPTPYNISLSPEPADSAALAARTMVETGSTLLSYVVTSNSQKVVNQGPMVDTHTVAGAGVRSAQVLAVQGKISAGEQVPANVYADTITVTIIY
jgi:spore coat protein U-like protein